MNKRGFTLIELLIVIVILGILLMAILSAINPLEQIRKATDSGKRADSVKLLNALERYYTTFQKYPWTTAPNGTLVDGATWLAELVSKAEVKVEFTTRKNLASLYATQDAQSLVHVCFVPESASFKALANKDVKGGTGTTHICIPE